MNKILFIIIPFLSGCAQKIPFAKKPDNQEVTQKIANQEIIHLAPDNSSFIIFAIIILSVTFFCFGLKYIPILYKKIKSLTKKDK